MFIFSRVKFHVFIFLFRFNLSELVQRRLLSNYISMHQAFDVLELDRLDVKKNSHKTSNMFAHRKINARAHLSALMGKLRVRF